MCCHAQQTCCILENDGTVPSCRCSSQAVQNATEHLTRPTQSEKSVHCEHWDSAVMPPCTCPVPLSNLNLPVCLQYVMIRSLLGSGCVFTAHSVLCTHSTPTPFCAQEAPALSRAQPGARCRGCCLSLPPTRVGTVTGTESALTLIPLRSCTVCLPCLLPQLIVPGLLLRSALLLYPTAPRRRCVRWMAWRGHPCQEQHCGCRKPGSRLQLLAGSICPGPQMSVLGYPF